MRKFLVISMAAVLAACSNSEPGHQTAKGEHITADGIVLSKAWVRPPIMGRTVAAGYVDIANGGKADRLVSVESDVASRVELHTHIDDGGIMKMRRVDGVDLPSGETVMFKPGGLHLMLFDVDLSSGRTDTTLTLKFETGPDLTIVADIMDPVKDKPVKSDDHSGH